MISDDDEDAGEDMRLYTINEGGSSISGSSHSNVTSRQLNKDGTSLKLSQTQYLKTEVVFDAQRSQSGKANLTLHSGHDSFTRSVELSQPIISAKHIAPQNPYMMFASDLIKEQYYAKSQHPTTILDS